MGQQCLVIRTVVTDLTVYIATVVTDLTDAIVTNMTVVTVVTAVRDVIEATDGTVMGE